MERFKLKIMKRIFLTDDSGAWFDAEKATEFTELTRYDGSNRISRATGSQYEHELLYFTAGGKWVMNCWSNWQGSQESYSAKTAEEAVLWLAKNEHAEEAEKCDTSGILKSYEI